MQVEVVKKEGGRTLLCQMVWTDSATGNRLEMLVRADLDVLALRELDRIGVPSWDNPIVAPHKVRMAAIQSAQRSTDKFVNDAMLAMV